MPLTLRELCEQAHLEMLCGDGGRQVRCVYCCDLLSWAMSRAPEDSAWVTVMGNVNTMAVCLLADCACVILAEGVRPDGQLAEKAAEQDIALLGSGEPVFETALKIYRALSGEAS